MSPKAPLKPSLLARFREVIRRRPLIRDTLVTTGWGITGKAAGYIIPFFIAAWFGVSDATDAFFFAYSIILFLSGMFAPVMESVVVPFIAEIRLKGGDIGRFVGQIMGAAALALVGVGTLTVFLSRPLLSLVTRFDPPAVAFINRLLLETAPLIVLLVWTSILSGALNACKAFVFPAVSPALRAAVIITVIFAGKRSLGVHAIALGYVLGEAARLLLLLAVIARRRCFQLSCPLSVDTRLREFFRTASYQTVGVLAVGLNPVIDKTMASWMGKGSVSVLYYAERLYLIPVLLLTTGTMVTTLSHWSDRYCRWGLPRLKADVSRTVAAVSIFALLLCLVLLPLHRPIVELAFGHGAFSPEKIAEVGRVWLFYLFGIVPYLAGVIYFQAHMTLKNTRVLMRCGFYRSALNIGLNYLFMKLLGVSGIALSSSVAAVVFLVYLRWKFLTFSEGLSG